MNAVIQSRFELHMEKWQSCTACPLCKTRQKVVLARGKLPCDVCFIGEAPGESEDCLGAPFVGPAGQLLDGIVLRAFAGVLLGVGAITDQDVSDGEPPRVAFANLVCCIPRDEATGGKTAQPEHDDILTCQVRLEEFVWDVAKPQLVVAVGKLAEDYLDQGYKHSLKLPKGTKQVSIVHPAAIIRASEAQRGLMAQRAEIILRDAVEEL